MTKRDRRLFLAAAVVGVVVSLWTIVAGRLQMYEDPSGGLNRGAVLLACTSGTLRYSYLQSQLITRAAESSWPMIDVAVACGVRKFRRENVLAPPSQDVALSALEYLVTSYDACREVFGARKARDCRQAHHDAIDWLLQQGVSIDEAREGGGTALATAIIRKDEDLFRFLLSRGSDLHAPFGSSGQTPLELLEYLASDNPREDTSYGTTEDREIWRRMLLLALNR